MKKLTLVYFGLIGSFASVVLMLSGCSSNKENVLAITSTVIGVQIHQKDADKTPEMKVGYARAEFAYVPTDKRSDTNSSNGSAANSAEVLMEINASGNVGLGVAYQGGVYQRLAVGKTAVSQPGAALMMAKDQNGNIGTNAAVAVANATRAVNTIQESKPDIEAGKRKILDAYNAASATDKQKFENAAKAAGYTDFNDFCTKTETSDTGLNAITNSLKNNGINL